MKSASRSVKGAKARTTSRGKIGWSDDEWAVLNDSAFARIVDFVAEPPKPRPAACGCAGEACGVAVEPSVIRSERTAGTSRN